MSSSPVQSRRTIAALPSVVYADDGIDLQSFDKNLPATRLQGIRQGKCRPVEQRTSLSRWNYSLATGDPRLPAWPSSFAVLFSCWFGKSDPRQSVLPKPARTAARRRRVPAILTRLVTLCSAAACAGRIELRLWCDGGGLSRRRSAIVLLVINLPRR